VNLNVYDLIKVAHVAAVITFIAGTLLAAVAIRAVAQNRTCGSMLLMMVRRWDTEVTTSAMLAVWGLGLALTMMGRWLPSGWLIAKLILVVLLSGTHGMNSGRLRRLAAGAEAVPLGPLPIVVIAVAVLTVFLVIMKPAAAHRIIL
jgi:protoporphyrinogen IX oxidase